MEEITKQIETAHLLVNRIRSEVGKTLVGQEKLVDGLLTGLLTGGHVLIEGGTGPCKNFGGQGVGRRCPGRFQTQFSSHPDLLPADLTGTEIYRPKTTDFVTRKGPLFNNIILADEINRAPSKVQSALLEAMEEKQVTIGDTTYALPSPFLVLATQNPIEQEGTYPLPEAQVDRFMLKVLVEYPSRAQELEILKKTSFAAAEEISPVIFM